MNVRFIPPLTLLFVLIAAGVASATVSHVVSPGESLSSVAAADGLTVDQLAAANGLSPGAGLLAGATLQIPAGSAGADVVSGDGDGDSDDVVSGDGDGDRDDGVSAAASSGGAVGSPAPSVASGEYVVRPGDTLSSVAASAGMTVSELAAINGISPAAVLVSGSALRLARGTGLPSTASSQPVGATAQGYVGGGPYPTPERVSSSQIGSIAAANGVPPSLADAIAWQESGFNNDLVSSADARGVMQILPGTWDWIQRSLTAGTPLSPDSAISNVRGGVLLLRSLLSSTGGDPALAAAGYYQGLPSVQQSGMYPSTQQYVNSVLALRQRFGGG